MELRGEGEPGGGEVVREEEVGEGQVGADDDTNHVPRHLSLTTTVSTTSYSPAAKPVALHRFLSVHASCNVVTDGPVHGRTALPLGLSEF